MKNNKIICRTLVCEAGYFGVIDGGDKGMVYTHGMNLPQFKKNISQNIIRRLGISPKELGVEIVKDNSIKIADFTYSRINKASVPYVQKVEKPLPIRRVHNRPTEYPIIWKEISDGKYFGYADWQGKRYIATSIKLDKLAYQLAVRMARSNHTRELHLGYLVKEGEALTRVDDANCDKFFTETHDGILYVFKKVLVEKYPLVDSN